LIELRPVLRVALVAFLAEIGRVIVLELHAGTGGVAGGAACVSVASLD